jgi:hypothetical protein
VIRGERNDVFRTRQSSLDLHLPWLDEPWSNGQTEDQITRLKLVRRQNVRSRENRSASSQIDRRRMEMDALDVAGCRFPSFEVSR